MATDLRHRLPAPLAGLPGSRNGGDPVVFARFSYASASEQDWSNNNTNASLNTGSILGGISIANKDFVMAIPAEASHVCKKVALSSSSSELGFAGRLKSPQTAAANNSRTQFSFTRSTCELQKRGLLYRSGWGNATWPQAKSERTPVGTLRGATIGIG